MGRCSISMYRNTICRKSCGSCGGKTEEKIEVEDDLEDEDVWEEEKDEELSCTDQQGEYKCNLWEDLGFCAHSKMRDTFCRKSCGACDKGKEIGSMFFIHSG